jgi:hypothetical protein
MAIWDSSSLKLNRVSSETAHRRRTLGLSESATFEPEVEGKWRPRTTLLFVVASCGLLWAAIFAAVFSLL